MKIISKFALLALLSLGLIACSSGVTRPDSGNSDYKYQGEKFTGVKVALTSTMQEKLAGNKRFDAEKMAQAVTNALKVKGLVDSNATRSLQIDVSDIRIRNTFNAVMFGFMAGNDHITGTVFLKDKSGATVHSFGVNAAYALGGFGGGQDDARMSWLYEEFGKVAAAEILGQGPVAQAQE